MYSVLVFYRLMINRFFSLRYKHINELNSFCIILHGVISTLLVNIIIIHTPLILKYILEATPPAFSGILNFHEKKLT